MMTVVISIHTLNDNESVNQNWSSLTDLLRNFVDADLFFQHFHESVRKMSGKYEKETKRFFFLSK